MSRGGLKGRYVEVNDGEFCNAGSKMVALLRLSGIPFMGFIISRLCVIGTVARKDRSRSPSILELVSGPLMVGNILLGALEVSSPSGRRSKF